MLYSGSDITVMSKKLYDSHLLHNISLKAACIPALKTIDGASEPISGHFVTTLYLVTNDGKKLNNFPCDVTVQVINSIKPSLI